MRKDSGIQTIIFFAASILFVTIFIAWGIIDHKNEETGEKAYISDIRISENELWTLRVKENECELYREDKKIFSFPEKSSVVYSEADECYYYFSSNVLSSYDPITGIEQELFILKEMEGTIVAAAENYLLMNHFGKSYSILDLRTGNAKKCDLNGLYSYPVFDVKGSQMLIWNYDSRELINLNCETAIYNKIVSLPDNLEYDITSAQFHNDKIFYVNNEETLYFIEETDEGVYSVPCEVGEINGPIAGIKSSEKGILCALEKENQDAKFGYAIQFVLFTGEKGVVNLDVWDNAGYYLRGSLLMDVSDDMFVSVVTIDEEMEVFQGRLP